MLLVDTPGERASPELEFSLIYYHASDKQRCVTFFNFAIRVLPTIYRALLDIFEVFPVLTACVTGFTRGTCCSSQVYSYIMRIRSHHHSFRKFNPQGFPETWLDNLPPVGNSAILNFDPTWAAAYI